MLLEFEPKLDNGEPGFILRAQDFSAPVLVRMWAKLNRINIGERKFDSAMKIADDMERWPNRKFPD